MSQQVWITISEIGLDSGTVYYSDQRVRRVGVSETIIYKGKVEAWGYFEQEIPVPAGPPRISEAYIEIADEYRQLRDLLSHQTARRRIMQINLLRASTSFDDSFSAYTGEIVKEVFPPAKVGFHLRDYLFSWLDEPFAVQVIPELYPDVAPQDIGGVIPIIIGSVRSINTSSPAIAQGVIPIPHIGLIGDGLSPQTFVDRWAVACHPVYEVVAVYRRESSQINVDENQPEWVLVDPSEYLITTQDFTAEQNPFKFGPFTVTNLDFIEQQPKGTQIRIDCDGTDRRGEWGPLSAIGFSPPVLIRNPIDAGFINCTYTFMYKAGVSVDIWDTEEIAALREQFEVGFGSPPVIPYCDRAITEILTPREFLSQFLASFNLYMFVNGRGKGTLRFIGESDPDRPVIKEGKHIIKESFIEEKPEFVANQTRLLYSFNNATNEFESPSDTIIDNTTEQIVLRLNNVDKIEREDFMLHFVRDEATALLIQGYRNDFLSLGSYRQEFNVPAPPLLGSIEPASLIGITHSMGLESPSGYVNREALITYLRLDLDKLEYTVRSVLREPQTIQFGVDINPNEESFRPVAMEVYAGNASRSRVISPDSAKDNDGPMGASPSAAQLQVNSTNSFAEYAKLFIWGWPVPNPLRTLTQVVFRIVIGGTYGNPDPSDHFGDPIMHVLVLNNRLTENASASLDAATYEEMCFVTLDGDKNAQTYALELTPTQYSELVAFCGGNPYNIYFRGALWATLSMSAIPGPPSFDGAYKMLWYDTLITFKYTPQ